MANGGGICTGCGIDAPLSVFFGDEQNVARHLPYWGKTGLKNMPSATAVGCAVIVMLLIGPMIVMSFIGAWHWLWPN